MFYGPPGTGKTLVAKQLARFSGLDYAIMSGGDVAPLGEGAVEELHKLFRWAEHSRKGLVLFIDEAEAFLKTRSDPGMSENARNALNALLYNTGSESRDFMLVLATNRPSDLDRAVADRVDEHIQFDLPGPDERVRLVKLYFDKYMQARGLQPDPGIDDALLCAVAGRLEGFSGRAISKLMISAQGAAYSSDDGVLTKAALEDVVAAKLVQRQRQQAMHEGHEADAWS